MHTQTYPSQSRLLGTVAIYTLPGFEIVANCLTMHTRLAKINRETTISAGSLVGTEVSYTVEEP